MIYKNIEIHNVAALYDSPQGGVSWLRVPQSVYDSLEHGDQARNMAKCSTGVELRFVIKSGDGVIIRMSKLSPGESTNVFHVFRGGIQGSWEDCELNKYVFDEPRDYYIKKSSNAGMLKKMASVSEDPWDPEVVRVIFDRGAYRLIDVIGDVAPPEKNQCPDETVLFYGSSITHGSNSIDMSHSWASVVGHNLKRDVINLGFAGSCAMEPDMINYISTLGEKGDWNICVMELGINVVGWENDKIYKRAKNSIETVAKTNPDKKIFVISPFYCGIDFSGKDGAENWRRIIAAIAAEDEYKNVIYINGLDLLGDMSGISADEVHPNIYGVQQIADRLTGIIKAALNNK